MGTILHRRAIWRALRRAPLPITITECAGHAHAKAIGAAEVLAVSGEVAAVELADRVRVIAITVFEPAGEFCHPHLFRRGHIDRNIQNRVGIETCSELCQRRLIHARVSR